MAVPGAQPPKAAHRSAASTRHGVSALSSHANSSRSPTWPPEGVPASRDACPTTSPHQSALRQTECNHRTSLAHPKFAFGTHDFSSRILPSAGGKACRDRPGPRVLLRGLDGQLRRGAPPLQMAGVAGIAGLSATMLLVLLPLAAAHAGHSHLGHDHSKCGTAASGEMLRQLNESRHAWESTLPPNAAETLRREDELDDRLKERRRLQHEAEPDWSDCTGRSAFVPREVYSPSAGEVYVIRTIIHIVHDGIIGLINERVVRRMVEMTNALHVRKFNTKIQFVLLETLYHDQPSWYQDNYHGEYGARECRNVLCERRDNDRHLNIFVYGL